MFVSGAPKKQTARRYYERRPVVYLSSSEDDSPTKSTLEPKKTPEKAKEMTAREKLAQRSREFWERF